MSAETTSIMVNTENSEGKRVSSNIQSIYASPNSLAAGDIIISNKEIFSVLTEVLQKTVSLMTVSFPRHSYSAHFFASCQ